MSRQTPVSLPKGYVEFYEKLESWQNEHQVQLKNSLVPLENIDFLGLIAEHRQPLVNIVNFKIKGGQFKESHQSLLQFLKTNRPEVAETINTIIDQISGFDFDHLATKSIVNDQQHLKNLANRLNISAEFLIFTFEQAIRPFLRFYAAPYYKPMVQDDFRSWERFDTCPFCGNKSNFSRLQATDGRRFMFCERCFTEWETRYLYCIHCGNDHPGSIRYLCLEDDDAYQLYVCDKCKGYLKTYNERQGEKPADLFIANVETVYLDILAKEKGYHNEPTGH